MRKTRRASEIAESSALSSLALSSFVRVVHLLLLHAQLLHLHGCLRETDDR